VDPFRRGDHRVTRLRLGGLSAGDPAARLQALIVVALSLTLAGRGPEGLARLGELPPIAAEVPLELTDGLVLYMLPFAAAMVLLAARIWPAAALPASQPHWEPTGLPVQQH